MYVRSLCTFIAAAALSTSACAETYRVGDIHITQADARATVPHQPSGAAYLTIENRGKTADKLLSVHSAAAESVEIHTMSMDGNVMRMREIQSMALPPAATVVMQRGDGVHLMLLGLKQPLKAGASFPMTVTFEKAGKVIISVLTRDM